jgi:hypothetical protein
MIALLKKYHLQKSFHFALAQAFLGLSIANLDIEKKQ